MNPYTKWQLILSQPCLPIAPLSRITTPNGNRTRKPKPATDFKSVLYTYSNTGAYFCERPDSNRLGWIFSPVLYPLGYFHIKEQVTGFEPVIFGLEDRRVLPATLNLHISCHARIRTRSLKNQNLPCYQLHHTTMNCPFWI